MRMPAKIVYSVIAASISIAGGVLRNKIFAAFLSVNLFGILSIGQQSVSLLFTLFAFGLPLGITTYAAQLLNQSDEGRRQAVSRIVILSVMLASCFGALLAFPLLLDPQYVSHAVTNESEYATAVVIILLSSPLMLIEICLFSIMEGMGRLRDIVIFRMVPVAVVLPILYVLVSTQHLIGAAIGLVVHEVALIVTGFFLLRKMLVLRRDSLRIASVFNEVFRVAVLSFIVGSSWLAVDFLVKRSFLATFGEVSNGIIQSVAKIADMYPTIALSWLTVHLFPVIATSLDDRDGALRAVERTSLVAVSMIVPIILFLFTFRGFVLEVLYKREFVLAVGYFGAMLTTGIPKVYSWVVGTALLPLGLRRQWLTASLFLILLYATLVPLGVVMGFEIYAIPVGLGVGQVLQAVYVVARMQSKGYRFSRTFWIQTAVYALLAVIFVGALFQPTLLIVATLLYIMFIYKFNLLNEIRHKLIDLGKKVLE